MNARWAVKLWVVGATLGVGLSAQQAPPAPAPAPKFAGKKKALLVANGSYRFLPPVPNARQDAAALRAALQELGWEVTESADLNRERLVAAISAFAESLAAGDAALFYFTGYAVQEDGSNYLLPTDFPVEQPDLGSQAYSVQRLAERDLNRRQTALNVLILDGSREVPKLVLARPGLAAQSLANTLVAMSALQDRTIRDTPGRTLSLYMEKLLAALRKPGLTLEELFTDVRKEVSDSTRAQQVPSAVSAVVDQFYFIDPKPVEPTVIIKEVEKDTGPRPGDVRPNRKDRQRYAYVPAGEFMMGCAPGDACDDDEKPAHKVRITKPFWMAEFEVQVEAYQRFVDDTKRRMPDAPLGNRGWRLTNHPINRVTWEDAKAFCEWAGGRLPTEAEWEWAARGGKTENPWGAITRETANFRDTKGNDRYDFTSPVGKFDPNGYGLFDMGGNVWELVADWYGPYSAEPQEDPKGPPTGTERVARGAGWESVAKEIRLSNRWAVKAPSNAVGFRCVLDDDTKPEPARR